MAQPFPSRAIRIFTTEAGGASDLPARSPAPIIDTLSREAVRVLRLPASRERLLAAGTEVVANTPGEAAAIIKSEVGRIRKLVNDAGLREQ